MLKPEDIKRIRLNLMPTQQEFAELLGVAYETVNRYENGKSNPTLKVQRRLDEVIKKYKYRIERGFIEIFKMTISGQFNNKGDLINKYDFKLSYATMKSTNIGD